MKCRHRVRTYGEVFTPRYMVDQMLDLVPEELGGGLGFVDKTFLEPAAGDGNFLVAILHRKLSAIEEQYPAGQWMRESLFALASIYGIELLEDNHQIAKEKMLAEFLQFHRRRGVRCYERTHLYRAAAFLIDTNIVRGDTLTGLDPNGAPIQFSWWTRVEGDPSLVQRDPFTFNALRGGAFDFTEYERYSPCRIEHVHREEKARG